MFCPRAAIIQHPCLETGTYSLLFMVQSVTLTEVCGRHTTCLRILCRGFLSFLVCIVNCLSHAMEHQALVIKQMLHWWSRCWMSHQFTQGTNFLGFHNRTWLWMVPKDVTCFCKLPIPFKGSKIFNNVLFFAFMETYPER